MNEIFIHIGFPKCGSTFLQKMVFPYLEDVAFVNKHPFVKSWMGQVRSFDSYYFFDRDFNAELKKEIGNNKKILISKEGFVGDPFANFADSTSIAHNLNNTLPVNKILIVIRKQDDFLNSFYSHYLKIGGRKNVENFLYYKNGEFTVTGRYTIEERDPGLIPIGVSPHALNYKNMIKNYQNIFGKEKVYVIPFELLEQQQNYLEKITAFTESKLNKEVDFSPVNQSLIGGEAKLPKFLNNFVVNEYNPIGFIPIKNVDIENPSFMTKAWVRFMPKSLKTTRDILNRAKSTNRDTLGSELREKIMALHQTSNRELDESLQLGLKAFHYY